MVTRLPEPVQYFVKKVAKYKKQILIVGCGLLTITLLIIGHSSYKRKREESAHGSFVQALEFFNAQVKAETKDIEKIELGETSFIKEEEKWTKVAEVFKRGYEDHKNSGIASIFLVFYSEALLRLGKLNESIQEIDKAIAAMPNRAMSDYYSVKSAMMKFDTKDGAMVKDGLVVLTKLAGDEQSVANDNALYHLGLYYWNSHNYDEAKNYWNQLRVKYGTESNHPSEWISLSEDKLKLIDSKIT
jgi:tetratricopeptide (TPR) repeat protein